MFLLLNRLKYDENKKLIDTEFEATTSTTGIVSTKGSVSFSSFFIRTYKIGRLLHFVMVITVANANDATWRIQITKYPISKYIKHNNVFTAFKGTGSYIPAYSDSDGYIVVQSGTGSNFNIQISGEYIISA